MAKRRSDWSVAHAKANFSELVNRAGSIGPQTITRHGEPVAVVVSVDEWKRKTRRRGNLAEFLLTSPLRDSGLEITARRVEPDRPVDL